MPVTRDDTLLPPPVQTYGMASTAAPVPAQPAPAEITPLPATTTRSELAEAGIESAIARTESAEPVSLPPVAVDLSDADRADRIVPVAREIPSSVGVSDAAIEAAIRRGIERLGRAFDPGTHQLDSSNEQFGASTAGMDALCVYALMQGGIAVNDPRLDVRGPLMKGLIDGMKRIPIKDPTIRGQPARLFPETYSLGIRATALAVFNRPEDRAQLQEDASRLARGHQEGRYTYVAAPPSSDASESAKSSVRRARGSEALSADPSFWDNSNSQYGLLGVWSAAEVNVEVPSDYWRAVEKHWSSTQLDSGQWSYSERVPGGTQSMTAAGIASLFVVRDYLESPDRPVPVGREPLSFPLKRGLQWWESADNAVKLKSEHYGYALYGVERVGLASGFKYFGEHDWYRTLANAVMAAQRPDGGWGTTRDTAYCLLFLARGRHPLLMNKLRFDGYWCNRFRDLNNLSKYVGKQLERPLNWQVVDLNHDYADWLDAPILYIASHRPPKFSDADIDKMRKYALAGGLIFTHADGDDPRFNEFATQFAGRLFPEYEFKDLPPEHPVYNVVSRVEKPVRLRGISNGARLLMLHSPTDLAQGWHLRDAYLDKAAFQVGMNLFAYAAGKQDLRYRINSTDVPQPPDATIAEVPIARLQYGGAWDPEPSAWERFSKVFKWQTSVRLTPRPIKWAELSAKGPALAYLTGTVQYLPTESELAATRAYVEGGGVLLVDDCGGNGRFIPDIRSALAKAFPGAKVARMDWTHPLFLAGSPGMSDLAKPRLRLFAQDTLGETSLARLEILEAGKGCVIFSKLDVTSGLLGTQTWGITGFAPDYAQALLKNAVFWTLDGHPAQKR